MIISENISTATLNHRSIDLSRLRSLDSALNHCLDLNMTTGERTVKWT